MGALYVSLIKTILILIVFYAAPGLFVVTELSEYFDCGASNNDLICTTVVMIFIVVFVLLMRIFVFPIYNKIETIRNNS